MSRSRSGGFTLIELLVALAIFAVLSAFAYRALAGMLESRAALERESRKWRDVTLFVGRLERDLSAVLKRTAIAPSGTKVAEVSSTLDTNDQRDGLAFTRSGAVLMENAQAAPQRVAYRRVGDRIERLTWGSVDAGPRDEPAVVPVLSGATALTFRFLNANGEWRSGWGLPGANDPLPNAVEATLELASGERIVRLFDLPRLGTP
jgi:general secretion pathway protein J